MEKSEMIIRSFMNEDRKFAFSEDIKKLCERYDLDYKKPMFFYSIKDS